MLQCFPDIQYSEIYKEHGIHFQICHLTLATILIYLHDYILGIYKL